MPTGVEALGRSLTVPVVNVRPEKLPVASIPTWKLPGPPSSGRKSIPAELIATLPVMLTFPATGVKGERDEPWPDRAVELTNITVSTIPAR